MIKIMISGAVTFVVVPVAFYVLLRRPLLDDNVLSRSVDCNFPGDYNLYKEKWSVNSKNILDK